MTKRSSMAAYREKYRAEKIPKGYRGWLHISGSVGGALLLSAIAASRLTEPTPLEWLTVPVAFLFANLVEYLGHRFPMHRRLPGFHAMFAGHAGKHHRFFHHDTMPGEGSRDFHATLFGPVQLGFFLGLMGTPPTLLLWLVAGPDVALLFGIVALTYFAVYECMHLAYHFPEDSWVVKLPGLRWLRHHHLVHHNPALMARYNFNITWPIWDVILGTRWTGAADVSGREVKELERTRQAAHQAK